MHTVKSPTLLAFVFVLSIAIGSYVFIRFVGQPSVVIAEDYRVYSAFLNTFGFYETAPSTGRIIVYDSTRLSRHDIHPQTPWPWVVAHGGERCRFQNDAVRCHKEQNAAWAPIFDRLKAACYQQAARLEPKFTVSYPVQLYSRTEIARLPDEPGEGNAPVTYIFGLSSVRYNATKTKALFFSSFWCGGTCGRGQLVMLEKVHQTWMLIDTFQFWIH